MAKHVQVLKRLLGRDNTDDTLATLAEAVKKLDKAGVTRKQEEGAEGEAAGGGADTMLDALESVGATDVAGLVAGILKVIDGLGGTEVLDTAAGGHAELVAKLIQAVTDGGAAAEPEVMEEEEDGMMTEEMLKDSASMKSIVKSLGNYAVRSIEDMGELARAQITLTETVQGIAGQVDKIDELASRLKSIEDLFSARPRSASKSSVTIVRSVDKDGEDDLEEVKKEMEGQEQVSVLGVKVNKRKDATYK